MFEYDLFNQSSVMVTIHDFVDVVLNLDIGYTEFTKQLSKLIPAFKTFDEEGLSYMPPIYAFKKMCEYIDQLRSEQGLEDCLSSLSQQDYRHCKRILTCERHLILEHVQQFQKQELANDLSLVEYVENIIADHYKVLLVRVDLGYRKEYLSQLKVTAVYEHIKAFKLLMKDHNGCFKDLLGYGVALEQGKTRGYHAHVFLIYNGSERCKDWYIADQVIQNWGRITQYKGVGMNLHTSEYKQKFAKNGRLGIGMIHRKNESEVQNALTTIRYLTSQNKFEQCLRITPMGKRTFFKGVYKKHGRQQNCTIKVLLKKIRIRQSYEANSIGLDHES